MLLAFGKLEFGVAAVGVHNDQVIFADGRGFQDGGILADGHLEPAGILQRSGQVQCLFAVTVVLALAAGEQEDLGAIRHFLLSFGRLGQATGQDYAQTEDSSSTHGRCSLPFLLGFNAGSGLRTEN